MARYGEECVQKGKRVCEVEDTVQEDDSLAGSQQLVLDCLDGIH